MKTTRINTGLYEFTYKGRTFQVEDHYQASDGLGLFKSDWNVYEIIGPYRRREWLNDYMLKRAAIHQTCAAVDAGH